MRVEADGRRGAPLVKIITGLLYPEQSPQLLSWARERLAALFGALERESDASTFDFTDYYQDISPRLLRRFFSFKGLAAADQLTEWKLSAIALEEMSGEGTGRRRINVDPGYVDGARLVLASTKDNAQRIYIAQGIFAETTMIRRKSAWEKFSYTFPDFKSGQHDRFLDAVRTDWRRDIRAGREQIFCDR